MEKCNQKNYIRIVSENNNKGKNEMNEKKEGTKESYFLKQVIQEENFLKIL